MRTNISTRKKNKGYQAIISYKLPGEKTWKQKTKQGFKTVREAKTWAHEKERELQDQVAYELNDHSDITVKKLIHLFLKTKEKTLAYSTLCNYKAAFKLLTPLYGKRVRDVKPLDFETLDLSGFSDSTINLKVTIIRSLFNFAVDYLEIIPVNPARKMERPPAERRKPKVVSIEIFLSKILPRLKKEPDIAFFYEVLLRTGGRRSEVRGLTYDDFTEESITIDKQYKEIKKGVYDFAPTKNKSKRIIPIPRSFYKKLLLHKIKYPPSPKNRIFPGAISYYITHYQALMKGSKYEEMTMHDYRHSFASNLIADGVDVQTVASLLGDTVEVTFKRYIHQTEEGMQTARRILQSK